MHTPTLRQTFLLLLAGILAAAVAVGCSGSNNDNKKKDEPKKSDANELSHESTVMQCMGLDTDNIVLGTAVVVSEQDMEQAECTPQEGEKAMDGKDVDFLVVSGWDRTSMKVTKWEGDVMSVEVLVPGEGCGVTADWRGQMVMAVNMADDGNIPDVKMIESPQPC